MVDSSKVWHISCVVKQVEAKFVKRQDSRRADVKTYRFQADKKDE